MMMSSTTSTTTAAAAAAARPSRASCAFVSTERALKSRHAHPETFLHDCDRENTYLHVHLDLAHSSAHKPVHQVAMLLRYGFHRLASQLHLRVIERREHSTNPTRPSYACADSQARKVLFGGAVLQATQTMELWQRYESEPGVLGIRLHFHHPDTAETLDDASEKKRARFVRLFNAAWVKLLLAHDLLTCSPFGADGQDGLVMLGSPTTETRPQHTYSNSNYVDAISNKRMRDPCDGFSSDENSSSDDCSSGSDDDSEGCWDVPTAQRRRLSAMTAESSASWQGVVAGLGQMGWHAPLAVNTQPLRSALKRTPVDAQSSRRSVSFASTRKFVCVPFSVEERAARMSIGNTPTFGDGFMKPLRSARTGKVVWLDAELDSKKNEGDLELSFI